MLHIEKKLLFFFYNLQKIASRYLQNYAHRKKSKHIIKKKHPVYPIGCFGLEHSIYISAKS